MTVELPLGFAAYVANIGVKDDTDDFVVLAAEERVPAAGVFTRSRFAGPSVVISRQHVADGWARAMVVVSKNANVANGPVGLDDACELVGRQTFPGTILVDQGEADAFLEAQLKPELFDQACAEAGQALLLRRHPGYDHSYWFIATFMDDHMRHHAQALGLA